jgi:GDPmannose 4,6-dehydratase
MSFQEAGIHIDWQGEGVEEKGLDHESGKVVVEVDPRYFRPAEVDLLIGDPSKAKEKLGWEPKVNLEELVRMMVSSDMKDAKQELHLRKNGFEIREHHE